MKMHGLVHIVQTGGNLNSPLQSLNKVAKTETLTHLTLALRPELGLFNDMKRDCDTSFLTAQPKPYRQLEETRGFP